MRHGRAKAARKTLQYFARTIGLKPPYHLLVDATFLVAMHQHHMLPVEERIEKVLQNHPSNNLFQQQQQQQQQKPTSFQHNRHPPTLHYILQSSVDELNQIIESLQRKKIHTNKLESFQKAVKWAEKYCTILQDPKEEEEKAESGSKTNEAPPTDDSKDDVVENKTSLTAAEAIWNYISGQQRQSEQGGGGGGGGEKSKKSNKNNTKGNIVPYIVATQDEELLDRLRYLGKVPIIRLASGSVLLLEQPSKSSKHSTKKQESTKWKHSLQHSEERLVEVVKSEQRRKRKLDQQEQLNNNPRDLYQERKRGKKKAKGANPLSCLSSKKNNKSNNKTISDKNDEGIQTPKTSDQETTTATGVKRTRRRKKKTTTTTTTTT